ncbi:Rec8 like protein-domain-containing protein [Xylariaceae sp. FL0255]|nr:Rec8 like protein-domain-containing protein [Xylariaceae sp. FL0255]
MFYSHEILTDKKYGVATIWLVATSGNKATSKTVSRKAIQGVDVKRACKQIVEPGAPIALRLQGNLLYGVSRVLQQQCVYLANDAKKVQDTMNIFFKTYGKNQLDPSVTHGRPDNLLIQDDPAFDPEMPILTLDFDSNLLAGLRNSQKTSSAMSPFSSLLSNSHSPGQVPYQLDIGHSESPSFQGSQFGLQGLSSTQKPDDEPLIYTQEDDVFDVQGDWGFEIDSQGNIIETAGPINIPADEPQLPPLQPVQGEDNMQIDPVPGEEERHIDDQLDIIMQEEPLPEAEPLPQRADEQVQQEQVQLPQPEPRPARQARSRKKKTTQSIDEETQISRTAINNWQRDYLNNCGTKPPSRGTSAAKSKQNAALLTFGLGIGNIGQNWGIPGFVHPLAKEFSGDSLFEAITGLEVVEKDTRRGTRRKVSEVTEDAEEEEQERRVRPRLEEAEDVEQARADPGEATFNLDDPFADDMALEVGREAQQLMSDHFSSSMMPWNRGSSVVPGSSIRKPGSAAKQPGRDLSSPSKKRGDSQDIIRYSDDGQVDVDFGSDGGFGGGFGSADSSLHDPIIPDPQAAGEGPEGQVQSQGGKLDIEGHNFRDFIRDAVTENGERRRDDDFDLDRKWIAFDDLFVPRTTTRATAAQAFYNTLNVVTKGEMNVSQEGAQDNTPFGSIWLGAKLRGGS